MSVQRVPMSWSAILLPREKRNSLLHGSRVDIQLALHDRIVNDIRMNQASQSRNCTCAIGDKLG